MELIKILYYGFVYILHTKYYKQYKHNTYNLVNHKVIFSSKDNELYISFDNSDNVIFKIDYYFLDTPIHELLLDFKQCLLEEIYMNKITIINTNLKGKKLVPNYDVFYTINNCVDYVCEYYRTKNINHIHKIIKCVLPYISNDEYRILCKSYSGFEYDVNMFKLLACKFQVFKQQIYADLLMLICMHIIITKQYKGRKDESKKISK